MSQPLILSIETATLSGSVAITRGRDVLGVIGGSPDISHSNTLLIDVDKILDQTQIALPEIDLFAVAAGPGSFTGLRIGIATIKALATTLDRPCAGVPTLEAVALSAGVSPATAALLPAGRGEVFVQLFSVPNDDSVAALDEAAHIPPAKLHEKYGQLKKLTWCGEGAVVHRRLIEEWTTDKDWQIAEQTAQLAPYIAKLALTRFQDNQIDPADAVRAIYVRPADAQLKV